MPLTGRWDVVNRLVSKVVDSRAAIVFAGAAGVGKSRLAAEVALGAERRGFAISHVIATRGAASIPFGAFAALMPEIVEPPGGLTSILQRAVEAIIERGGEGRRLLIVIDDAHLLDDGSAALVLQLAREAACGLVATIRSPMPTPDSITALWKDNLAERLDLEVLSRADVKDLVTAMLGGPMTEAGISWLWEVSAGNPLYLREVLIGALDANALRDEDGVWTLRLPLPWAPRLA